MKMRNLKFAAIAIIAVVTLGACKKGENDPFLSLKSRNARITGVWNLTEGSSSITSVQTFNGTTYTDIQSTTTTATSQTQTDNGSSITIPYTQTMEIMKDGTYVRTVVAGGSSIGQTHTGNWWWENSNKKKVRIAFDDDAGSMYIDRLKNKELVLTYDEIYSSSSSTDTYTSSMTFEKQ
jgi:hypothetical protein